MFLEIPLNCPLKTNFWCKVRDYSISLIGIFFFVLAELEITLRGRWRVTVDTTHRMNVKFVSLLNPLFGHQATCYFMAHPFGDVACPFRGSVNFNVPLEACDAMASHVVVVRSPRDSCSASLTKSS